MLKPTSIHRDRIERGGEKQCFISNEIRAQAHTMVREVMMVEKMIEEAIAKSFKLSSLSSKLRSV